jgi:hypothetical protein
MREAITARNVSISPPLFKVLSGEVEVPVCLGKLPCTLVEIANTTIDRGVEISSGEQTVYALTPLSGFDVRSVVTCINSCGKTEFAELSIDVAASEIDFCDAVVLGAGTGLVVSRVRPNGRRLNTKLPLDTKKQIEVARQVVTKRAQSFSDSHFGFSLLFESLGKFEYY